MDVAVLKYLYISDKPSGIPDEWPAEVIPLTGGVVFPPDGRNGWIQMTENEYAALISTNQASYDAWESSSYKKTNFLLIDNPIIHFDDFRLVSTTGAGTLGWQVTSSGTSAAGLASVAGELNCLGVAGSTTGTTATGRSSRYLGLNDTHFGQGSISFSWKIRIPILSDATNRFVVYLGWGDTSGSGDMVDGVYFTYSDTINTGNWTLNTSSSSIRTALSSNIPVNTNWTKLTATVNDFGTTADFYIDGILAGTISTNIPTAPARQTGALVKIEKTVGTTARTIYYDYYYDKIFFTSPR
jgi:hypothetical protein